MVARTTTSGTVVVVAEGVAGPGFSADVDIQVNSSRLTRENEPWLQGRRGRADGLQPPRS
jgi:hypothetical protein